MSDNGVVYPAEKAAIITGCGGERGIGRVLAKQLWADGWSLALIDRDADGVARLKAELEELGGETKAVAIGLDVTDPDAVEAAFATIEAELPQVVGLVNLAGIPSPQRLDEASYDHFQQVMAVNVTGSFLMLKGAAALMKKGGVGRIVNTSSLTAYDGGGTFSKGIYAAAKAGVLGLTRGGARELGPLGITVNAIAPGPVDTDIMGGRLTDERKASMSATIPIGRVSAPAEVAATIAFLLSPLAGGINGATIVHDGGKHMQG